MPLFPMGIPMGSFPHTVGGIHTVNSKVSCSIESVNI